MAPKAEGLSSYASGTLTARQLVQLYLDRIEAYDQKGPHINSVVTLNAARRRTRRAPSGARR